MDQDKRRLGQLKRDIKRAGNKRRRQHLKRDLADNPKTLHSRNSISAVVARPA